MKLPFFALVIFILFMAPAGLMAQLPREGWHAGGGIGGAYYTSHWYYHRSDGNPYHDNYPTHTLDRTMLMLSLEKHTLFPIKVKYYDVTDPDRPYHFDFDAGAELLLGLKGNTRADWIADEPVISSGGYSVGLNGYFKALIVLTSSKKMNLSPFMALGPQFMMIHNNGKDVETNASAAYYDYKEGWNEYLTNLVFSLGMGLEFPKISIVPEIRLGLLGFGSSSWEPNAGGVSSTGAPGFWGLSIKVLKKL